MTTVPTSLRSLVAALLLLCLSVPLAHAAAPADAPASFDRGSVYIYAPSNAARISQPLQVVFALHGMGGEGKGFCQGLLGAADRQGWIVVAPTFSYRNWRDPAVVAADDIALTRGLVDLLVARDVAHEFHVLPGNHNGDDYWAPHGGEYLRFYARAFLEAD